MPVSYTHLEAGRQDACRVGSRGTRAVGEEPRNPKGEGRACRWGVPKDLRRAVYADERRARAPVSYTHLFLQTGKIAQETIDKSFEDAYDAGLEEDREFYALDRLWAEAPRIELGVENEAPFDIEGETEEDAARIIPAQDEA